MPLLPLVFPAAAMIGAATADLPMPAHRSAADPRLDQIQMVGTHNSYSLPVDPRVMDRYAPRLAALGRLVKMLLPARRRATLHEEHPSGSTDPRLLLGYVQPPLAQQLAAGVRSVELDLHADPDGGRYADPLPYRELARRGMRDLLPIPGVALRRPGLKVFHVADLDFRSQCPTFRDCLSILRRWSDATPGHSPVIVLLEPKVQDLHRALSGAVREAPFDARAFAEVDGTIAAVIGRERVFAPDDLRGELPTLEAAALDRRWPALSAVRGKFVFLFLVPGMKLEMFAPYFDGAPSLQGRMAFVQGRPGMAHAAFLLFDNALVRRDEIAAAVRRGYMVRTRADIDTADARDDDPRRRDAALSSGAQVVSTDYIAAPNVHGTGYHLAPFAGGWRCDPVARGCRSTAGVPGAEPGTPAAASNDQKRERSVTP